MSSNEPTFDPLNATAEEADEMFEGYRAGSTGKPKPPLASVAFEHGYRMARNDKAGIADDDQRELARRVIENERRAEEIRRVAAERSSRLRRAMRGPNSQA